VNKFKVGDKVRRVKDVFEKDRKTFGHVGCIYTVESAVGSHGLYLKGLEGNCRPSSFELASRKGESPKPSSAGKVPCFKERASSKRTFGFFFDSTDELDGMPLPDGTIIHLIESVDNYIEFYNPRFKANDRDPYLVTSIIEVSDWDRFMEPEKDSLSSGYSVGIPDSLNPTLKEDKIKVTSLDGKTPPTIHFEEQPKDEPDSFSRCTCGADKAGLLPYHSQWCDKVQYGDGKVKASL